MFQKIEFIRIILVYFVGSICLTRGDSKNDTDCNPYGNVDLCMQKSLIIGDSSFKFPLDRNEMNVHCKTLADTEKCVKKFSNKCLETYLRQVVSVWTFSLAKTNKGYCSSKKRMDKFISLGSCYEAIKDGTGNCMQDFIDTLLGIENLNETEFKIPLVCCNYYKQKQCILGLSQRSCNQEQSFEIEKIVDGYINEVHNLMCGEYTEDSDKCDSIYGKEPKKLVTQKRPASLLPSIIKILSDV